MKILLTNDDGIDAEGLAALESAVIQAFTPEHLWVVAPDQPRSQCSHATTTHIPLEAKKRAENRYAVSGFPADCVRIALFGLGFEPDWVFSGINHGGNLGHDIVLSGTVAAAREAAYHGIAAVAISHFINRGPIDWDRAARQTAAALLDIHPRTRGDAFWNVNLPHPEDPGSDSPAVTHCPPARTPLPAVFEPTSDSKPDAQAFSYTGSYQNRTRDPGSDVEACFGGSIAVSRIPV